MASLSTGTGWSFIGTGAVGSISGRHGRAQRFERNEDGAPGAGCDAAAPIMLMSWPRPTPRGRRASSASGADGAIPGAVACLRRWFARSSFCLTDVSSRPFCSVSTRNCLHLSDRARTQVIVGVGRSTQVIVGVGRTAAGAGMVVNI